MTALCQQVKTIQDFYGKEGESASTNKTNYEKSHFGCNNHCVLDVM